ncbi:MAG: phosphoglycerate dehydrogenase [Lawsonibacter sp.]|nr:phosphoglycerate dehydrogenase [Lawsonibacter sp.]
MKKIVSFFAAPSQTFDQLNQRAGQYARDLGYNYRWAPMPVFSPEQAIEELKNADAGIIDVEPYGEEIFKEIQGHTSLLVRFGVGFDKVDLPAASRHGIAVARTTAANASGVAEMALTLILAARRGLRPNRIHCIETGVWERSVAHETAGNTVGIVGFGAIGRILARLARGLGCRVLAYDPFPNQECAREMGVELVDLDELFQQSDAISIHVPYCADTHHIVDARRLAQMKPSAVIVNTARGNLIDEDALYDALKARRICGAGLDVFAQEPLPVSSRLLELDNLILSPHFSSQTVESLWNTYKMAIDIADDFFSGRQSPHILNPEYQNFLG